MSNEAMRFEVGKPCDCQDWCGGRLHHADLVTAVTHEDAAEKWGRSLLSMHPELWRPALEGDGFMVIVKSRGESVETRSVRVQGMHVFRVCATEVPF